MVSPIRMVSLCGVVALIAMSTSHANTITASPGMAVMGGTAEVTFTAQVGQTQQELDDGWTLSWTVDGESVSGGPGSLLGWTPTQGGEFAVHVDLLDKQNPPVVQASAEIKYSVVDIKDAKNPDTVTQQDDQGRYWASFSLEGVPPGGTYAWSKTYGPGNVSFVEPNSMNPIVYFDTTGTYGIELTYTLNDAMNKKISPIKVGRYIQLTTVDSTTAGQPFRVSASAKPGVQVTITPDAGYTTIPAGDPLTGDGTATVDISYAVVGVYTISASAPGYATATKLVNITQPNMNASPTVTINDVVRDTAGAYLLPPSLPPGKTRTVDVVFPASWDPNDVAVFSVENGDDNDCGTATIEGNQPTSGPNRKERLTIKGGTQTSPGKGGRLRIVAKVGNMTRGSSATGFSVCAHPYQICQSYNGDADPLVVTSQAVTKRYWGTLYSVTFKNDSGNPSDPQYCNQTQLHEVVQNRTSPTGIFAVIPTVTTSGFTLSPLVTGDKGVIGGRIGATRVIADILIGGLDAREDAFQHFVFSCARCGIPADATSSPVVRHSSFRIIHTVSCTEVGGQNHYYIHTTKFGEDFPEEIDPNLKAGLQAQETHVSEIKD